MLRISGLKKKYGDFQALDGLDLEINKGQLYGFVGPNGAGKTTTMKIVAGLLRADEGAVTLDGVDILKDGRYLKKSIGYMPDFFGVYDNLEVFEYMEFFASAYGIDKATALKRIDKLLKLVGLEDKRMENVDGLSRGMKQRLCLARTMIHEPKLLLLDEPASGMEPRARVEMQEILKHLALEGTTIIVSSHVLSELAEMCTHIGIIENGKMIITGTMDEITARQGKERPILMQVMEGLKEAVKLLKSNPLVYNIAIKEQSISFGFEGGTIQEAELLTDLVSTGAKISEFKRKESNLESIFLKLTE